MYLLYYNIYIYILTIVGKIRKCCFTGNNIGDPSRTSVRVPQGCSLSSVLFNIFLEQIMSDTLINHHSSISICGREISNIRLANDIDPTMQR